MLLKSTEEFNYEIKKAYFIRVQTTSEEGLFLDKSFLINVKNVNEPPRDLVFY